MIARFRTVNAILGSAGLARPVRKADLTRGSRVVVATENSIYSIEVLEDSTYSVRGGWFDRQGLSPARISIAGCTWGGTLVLDRFGGKVLWGATFLLGLAAAAMLSRLEERAPHSEEPSTALPDAAVP